MNFDQRQILYKYWQKLQKKKGYFISGNLDCVSFYNQSNLFLLTVLTQYPNQNWPLILTFFYSLIFSLVGCQL
jgi:hypothetical protein